MIIVVGIYYCFFKKQKADESLEKTEKSGQTSARKHNKNTEPIPRNSGVLLSKGSGSFNMETGTISDIHDGHTGMFESDEHADQQEELDSAHRAYIKETPIRPWNLIIPDRAVFAINTLSQLVGRPFKSTRVFECFYQKRYAWRHVNRIIGSGYCSICSFYVSAFSCRRACYPFY